MSNEEKILGLLQAMQASMTTMQANMTAMQADLSATKADMQGITAQLDKLESKVDQQKKELQAEIKASEGRMIALQEAWFEPKFGALADGQKLIQEKMLPMEALDDMEDRLDVLEAIVKLHSREIEKLKKAQ